MEKSNWMRAEKDLWLGKWESLGDVWKRVEARLQ